MRYDIAHVWWQLIKHKLVDVYHLTLDLYGAVVSYMDS
jgi:hypothetical protein